jgi:hypothetical protein
MSETEATPPDDAAPPLAPPPPPRRWPRLVALLVLALVLIGLGTGTYLFCQSYCKTGRLEPRGGLYFFRRVELPGPVFRQNDPRWGKDPLGPSDDTLGSAGCAVSSAAMILASYGVDTDPQRLNNYLTENEGYTPQGWLYWEKAAAMAPDRVRHVYEDLASYERMDMNLLRGNPVIVKLRLSSGITHFVVIAGKEGFDYLTRDPGAGASRGLYPLRELHSKIEGLRYYEKLK